MGILRLFYRMPWLLVHLLIGLPLTLLSIATPARAIRIGDRSLDEGLMPATDEPARLRVVLG